MGLYQTEVVLHRKGNHQQNQKTTYGLREIFANDAINKGLIVGLKHTNSSYNLITAEKDQ